MSWCTFILCSGTPGCDGCVPALLAVPGASHRDHNASTDTSSLYLQYSTFCHQLLEPGSIYLLLVEMQHWWLQQEQNDAAGIGFVHTLVQRATALLTHHCSPPSHQPTFFVWCKYICAFSFHMAACWHPHVQGHYYPCVSGIQLAAGTPLFSRVRPSNYLLKLLNAEGGECTSSSLLLQAEGRNKCLFLPAVPPWAVSQENSDIKYPSQIPSDISSDNGQLGAQGREEEWSTEMPILTLAGQKRINICWAERLRS